MSILTCVARRRSGQPKLRVQDDLLTNKPVSSLNQLKKTSKPRSGGCVAWILLEFPARIKLCVQSITNVCLGLRARGRVIYRVWSCTIIYGHLRSSYTGRIMIVAWSVRNLPGEASTDVGLSTANSQPLSCYSDSLSNNMLKYRTRWSVEVSDFPPGFLANIHKVPNSTFLPVDCREHPANTDQ